MSVGQGSTITRGFLFADLDGYTEFVEQRGAAAAAELLTQYRGLAREAIAQCAQAILASLEAVAADGPGAEGLREALRAYAVDPDHRFETTIGTVGFDANGDSTQQVVSFLRVDPQAADGAGDWDLIKQQDFGPSTQL